MRYTPPQMKIFDVEKLNNTILTTACSNYCTPYCKKYTEVCVVKSTHCSGSYIDMTL